MPPQIASLLCILFILCIFTIDLKRKSNVTHALWVPLMWLMIIGSRPVALWLTSGPVIATETDYLSGNPIDRTIYILLIVIGVVLLARRRINWSQIFKSNIWIIVLIWYSMISILWSDFPEVAFKRWIKEIGIFIMVLVVLTEDDSVQAVKTLIRRCAYVLIPLSILFIKYYPHLGRTFSIWTGIPANIGVTSGKNQLGLLCLVCGVFFFWNLFTIWRKKNVAADTRELFINILFLIMISWLLVKANSATSLICFIIGIFTFIGLSIIKRNVRYLGILILHISIITLTLQLSIDTMEMSIDSLGRDMTFTGRTDLWKDVINMGTNPLIGTGYDSFWLGDRMTELWANHWWQPNQAHNGYIEIYLNLGLIGLFLLLGIIFFTYRKIGRTLLFDFDYGRFGMSFLIIILVYNLMEATFKGASMIWFIFLLLAVDVPLISQFQIPGTTKYFDFNVKDT